jgi:hypothetical protein
MPTLSKSQSPNNNSLPDNEPSESRAALIEESFGAEAILAIILRSDFDVRLSTDGQCLSCADDIPLWLAIGLGLYQAEIIDLMRSGFLRGDWRRDAGPQRGVDVYH